jgi:hypothetical protein
MPAIPLELPMKAGEAAALAELVIEHVGGRAITNEMRARLAGRASGLGMETITPYWGSLALDPVHATAYYLAVDAHAHGKTQPMLLRLAPSTAPASGTFPKAILIGRMTPSGTREVVVNAIPFSSQDCEALHKFVQEVDPAFLPRPQGAQPAIAVGNRHPEVSLPAAFDAFAKLHKSTGVNYASTVQLSATREMTTPQAIAERDGEIPTAAGHTRVSIPHLYDAGLWAAIRAGWREGYSAEADHFIIRGDTPDAVRRSVEAAKEAIHLAAGYTKFTTDTSRLFELQADRRHPDAWSDAEVESRFEQIFQKEDREWVLDEFAREFACGEKRYRMAHTEIVRLAVKFGNSLLLNEELYDFIRREKAMNKRARAFDFEPSIDEAETLTTPEEMIFYMHWLKSRGRPAQLVPPNLGFKKRQAYPEAMETGAETGVGLRDYTARKMWPELLPRVAGEFGGNPLAELGARVRDLAAVARTYNGTLSIHSGSGKQAAVLNAIGQTTGGRWNYKISGELQLQLFDVLREQPEASPWRQLYERMAERCNEFAARGAFGEESGLASKYRPAKGSFLGDAARGRVDGNLFLVFWVGNMVGSRDITSPDGDTRFFKDKLDELPAELVAETRRRNSAYIIWLAKELRG